ncbi:MAG: tetratricopeptide repeat protein [Chloroflexi bacterium]|nr:tetratricopeptide repeat protein [Chloroflexota bacterium]
MRRLQLALLGSFQAILDGLPLRGFESDKARALLVFLAVEPDRAHPRDLLASLLWPDYAPPAARANLRNTLANLREVLGDALVGACPFLLITRETIQFNSASDHRVDALDLVALLGGERTIGQLQKAISLYQGDFLAGFALKDSAPFEDWVLLTRERLRRAYTDTLRQLATEQEERGEIGQALESARRWSEVEAWDEEAHRTLMRLLARDGQRAAALAQYEKCCRALEAELGVEPEAATTQLHERIRSAEGGGPPRQRKALNLPISLFPLVGRQEELARIAACLRDPACRLLTLVGPGGAGKTHLAAEAARKAAALFEDGLGFAPLSAVGSPPEMVPAIARSLGLALHPGAAMPPPEQVLAYLREKRLLLVLDSCEHLLDGAPLISAVLAVAPEVKVLATSRARLNLPGEQVFPVEGLEYRETRQPGDGGLPPAGELFVTAARRVRSEYELSAADAPAVAAICQRVEGLPLAILLAASWMHVLGPADIAARLAEDSGHGLDFLVADWQGVPEHERSMRAALDRSWSLLSAREQAAFAALAVFRSGFTAGAAQEVAGATLRDLARLVDRSLVYRRGSGRYDLHDLLREYGEGRLAESEDRGEGVRDRHADYYAQALRRWEADLWSSREMAALQQMSAEAGNLRAAWDRAVAQGQLAWLERAANSLGEFLSRQGRRAEGAEACGKAVSAVEQMLPEGGPRKGLALLLGWQGRFHLELAHLDLARQLLRRALDLLAVAQAAGEEVRRERAWIARRLGNALGVETSSQGGGQYYLGLRSASESAETESLYRQSLSLAQEVGDHVEMAGSLKDLASLAVRQGRLEEARQLQDEALALLRELGAPGPLFLEMITPAVVLAIDQGRFADAEQLVDQIASYVRELGDPALNPWALDAWANGLFHLGRLEEAQPLYERCVALFGELGLRPELAREQMVLGRNLMLKGRYAEAQDQLEQALALSEALGCSENALECCIRLGFTALGSGDTAGVESWLRRCLTDYPRTDEAYPHYVLWLRAHVRWERGQVQDALRDLREIGRRCVVQNMPGAALSGVVPLYGRYLVRQGQVERAAELYALSGKRGLIANSRWFGDIGWRHVAETIAALPPEAREAAEARGRARDWQATALALLAELEAETA